ncbi:UNVERIFIED_CONTAM: hypothetical protein FKN15_034272 [Acipenser sinensis]
MVAECVGAPTTQKEMESIEELIKRINSESIEDLIERINSNTAAQKEQTIRMEEQTMRMERELRESGWVPLERREREPTELELLLQKWEQAEEARLSAAPAREAPESPAPEELLQGEQEEETVPEPEEVSTTPPPQLQPTTPEEDPALVSAVPCPLLLDTLLVFLDLPALGLEPRSLNHRPQLCPWFPTPLSPSTQTSLGCCQMSLVLPLFAAKLPRVIGHRCVGPQVKTSARCCSLLFPGCRFGRPCHPGGVPSRRFKVPSWKRRRNRPTLKPARVRGRKLTFVDSRVGTTELSISELPKAPSCDDALCPAYRGYKPVTHWKISLFFLLKTKNHQNLMWQTDRDKISKIVKEKD